MKKKCLIIIPGIPFPPINGYKLKIYNLIMILSKVYDLHLVTVSKEDPNDEEMEFINVHSYKSAHFKIKITGTIFRIVKNIFLSTPFQVAYYTLPEVKRYLKLNSKDDDFIVLNLVRTAGYLPLFQGKKIVFDMVDLISKSYIKSSKSTYSKLFKAIYKVEIKRLVGFEKDVVEKSELTLCVNKDDSNYLNALGKVLWLPNGVNEKLFTYHGYNHKYENCIAFIGNMAYQPNIDAILWFDKYVMEYLNTDITVFIIGPGPTKQIVNLTRKRKNLVVTGFLDDPYLILNSCFAVIAPMQNGGGIQNKILETMGMGKINVVSSYGAQPIIGAKDKIHFFIEDSALSMADRLNDIFSNRQNYISVGKDARELILNNYTWSIYEKRILKQLFQL